MRAKAGLAAALWLAAAALLAESALYARHTLEARGGWLSGKRMLELGVSGDRSFLRSRAALHRGELDLGRWWGFHELWSERAMELDELSLRLRLEPGAYIDVLLDGESGVRLSRSARRPGGFFRQDAERAFSRQAALPEIEDGGWRTFSARFGAGEARVELDGRPLGTARVGAGARRFALRSGRASAVVDDVRARGRDGAAFHDDFSHRRGWAALFAGSLLVSLALLGAAPALAGGGVERRLSRFIALAAGTLIGGAALLAADRALWAGREEDPASHPGGFDVSRSVESARLALFRPVLPRPASPAPEYPRTQVLSGPFHCAPGRGCRRGRPAPAERPKAGLRVLVAGGSQALGSGAAALEDAFFARLHRAFDRRPGGSETLNIALPGGKSTELLESWTRDHADFRPHLLVLDLGNNDSVASLEKGLPGLLDRASSLGARVALVKEANSDEDERACAELALKHRVIERLGRERGVRVVDLHRRLNEPALANSGALWWDWVHLSSYGHRLAADSLLRELP